jgi:hypothetical protein
MKPQFAIAGPGWDLSFQRRVGTANRGALPFVGLDSLSDRTRVLVPLRAGEALWIAVMADPAIVVDGHAGEDPLRVVRLSQANDGSVLQALDAVLRLDRWLPLNSATVEWADNRTKIVDDPLTVVLKNPLQGTVQWIAIVPATPGIYEALSDLPAPRPSTERDEYRGWRLP